MLRAGKYSAADMEHIAQEIESMGKTEKRELASRLSVLLLHLLKWQFQPERRGASWEASIRVQRNRIADHLADNPSLKPTIPAVLKSAWRDAVLDAVAETEMPIAAFPEVCLYSYEQIKNEEFWPG